MAPSTPSGDPQRDTPPAQGGIEILGNAEVWLVVDVPVTMHYKFQQSSPIYSGGTSDSFIDRVLDIAGFGWSSTCPLLCNDRAWVRQWRKLLLRSCIPLTRWLTSLSCRSCRFSGAGVEQTVVSHSCSC